MAVLLTVSVLAYATGSHGEASQLGYFFAAQALLGLGLGYAGGALGVYGVVLTSVERDGRYLVPEGQTRFAAGDRIQAFARPSNLAALRQTFGEARVVPPRS